MNDLYVISAMIKKKNGKYDLLEDLTLSPSKDHYLLGYITPFVRIGTLKSKRSKSGRVKARWRKDLPPILRLKLEEMGYEFLRSEGLAEFSADEFSELIGYVRLKRKYKRKRR